MHYYINGNRTGDSQCFDDFDEAQAELLRMIAEKITGATALQVKIVGRCMGEVGDWAEWAHDSNMSVVVGSDAWSILECSNYECRDMTRGGDW